MPDGPGGFTQGCTCPALLRVPLRFAPLRVRSYHALWPGFPARSAHGAPCDIVALQPPRRLDGAGLGCSPFARRYWGNHSYFLFLRVLRCFSSPRWPPAKPDDIPSGYRVVPFGDPRIKGHLRLPAAFRSLSRPSSPPRAKASAMCPSFLLRLHARGYRADGYTFDCRPIGRVACIVTPCHRPEWDHPRVSPRRTDLWRITDSNR